MIVTIIVGVACFIVGVVVGIVWTNIAISNHIARHFGW